MGTEPISSPPLVVEQPTCAETRDVVEERASGRKTPTFFVWVGRSVIALLAIAVVALMAYAAYRLIAPRWSAVLFYLYFTTGVFAMVFGLVRFTRQLKAEKQPRDVLLDSVNKARSQKPLSRVRLGLYQILDIVGGVAVWPVGIALGMAAARAGIGARANDFANYLKLQTWEAQLAIYTATCIATAVAVTKFAGTEKGYGVAFIYLAAISVLVRGMKYAIDEAGLPQRLRLS